MPAITINDLSNAKLDVDHISEFATTTAPTVTDRLGNVKPSIAGLSAEYPNASVNAAAAAADALASEASRLASGLSAGLADAAKTAAELARDFANATGKIYATAAAGVNPTGTPAGVADGAYFGVISASSADLIDLYRNVAGVAISQGKSFPSSSSVTALQTSVAALQADAPDIRHVDAGTAGVFPIVDLGGKLLFDLTLDGDLVSPHIERIDSNLTVLNAAAAGVNAVGTPGTEVIFAMADTDGRLLLAQQSDGDPYSPVRDARIAALENTTTPLYLVVVYGQSNAQGDVSYSQTWRTPMTWGAYPPGYAGELDGSNTVTSTRTGDTWTLAADRASLSPLTSVALGADYGECVSHGLIDPVTTRYPGKRFCVLGHGSGGRTIAYLDKPTPAEITAGTASGLAIPTSSAEYLLQTAGKTMANILDYAYATCASPYYKGMWMAAKAAALAASINSRLARADMVWLQGESDGGTSTYAADLQSFWATYAADLMLATSLATRPVMLVEQANYSNESEVIGSAGYDTWVASGYTDTSAYLAESVRVNNMAAINGRQVVGVESGLYASPKMRMYLAAPRYPLSSRIHMNPHVARAFGEQLGKVYAKTVLEGQDWQPLKPLSVWFDAAHIYIQFAVPKAPLQFVIPPQGTTHHLKAAMSYGLEHSAGAIQPANVKIMGGDVIRITPDVAPASGQTIGYVQSARYGSLCDSDATPGFFTNRAGAANVLRNYCLPFSITL